jgi:hypothetical protein
VVACQSLATAGRDALHPTLSVIDSQKVSFKGGFAPTVVLTLGPAERLIASTGEVIASFDSTGTSRWTMESLSAELRGPPLASGWLGNRIWLSDATSSNVAIVDAAGRLVESRDGPLLIRPPIGSRLSFPAFGALRVYSLLADGDLVGIPGLRLGVPDRSPDRGDSGSFVVRVAPNGTVKRVIAYFPRLARQVTSGMTSSPVQLIKVASDGGRVVRAKFIRANGRSAGPDTIEILAIRLAGDTAFFKRVSYPTRAIMDGYLDTIASRRLPGASATARLRELESLKARYSPLVDLTVGTDYSVWLSIKDSPRTQVTVGTDSIGRLVGTVRMPKHMAVKAAHGSHLWAVDTARKWTDVTRYTVRSPLNGRR